VLLAAGHVRSHLAPVARCRPAGSNEHRLRSDRTKRRLLCMPNRDPDVVSAPTSVVPRCHHRPPGNLTELCLPRFPVPYRAPQAGHLRAGRELVPSCLLLATEAVIGSCHRLSTNQIATLVDASTLWTKKRAFSLAATCASLTSQCTVYKAAAYFAAGQGQGNPLHTTGRAVVFGWNKRARLQRLVLVLTDTHKRAVPWYIHPGA
jgi:hypothetical protein